MRKFYVKLGILLSIIAINNCYAQNNYNGDSVMMAPNWNPAKPMISTNGSFTKTQYAYEYYKENQLTSCPVGYTGDMGTQYISAQRLITKILNGSTPVQTIIGPWETLDNDCFKRETRTVDCPAGYSGSITQTRPVSSNGDSLEWTETASTCVYNPPPPSPPACVPVYILEWGSDVCTSSKGPTIYQAWHRTLFIDTGVPINDWFWSYGQEPLPAGYSCSAPQPTGNYSVGC
ncbi:hypothetical protein [Rugamonas rubra]|uniref:Secreted protein n=1 Tax=Rugamonas rubra TaxID=758825 RepID=A0A1I4UA92_9BURK|nr:hypothetical protein [Rugamonas rubra]SFM85916.1 hypothetical protein SAMN02982985_05565 [Rugamonas rubra]